jgi:hypothetical protein
METKKEEKPIPEVKKEVKTEVKKRVKAKPVCMFVSVPVEIRRKGYLNLAIKYRSEKQCEHSVDNDLLDVDETKIFPKSVSIGEGVSEACCEFDKNQIIHVDLSHRNPRYKRLTLGEIEKMMDDYKKHKHDGSDEISKKDMKELK